MNAFHVSTNKSLSRRTMLRAAGVCVGLPFLDAMTPAFARAAQNDTPRRMLAVNVDMGFMADRFFPKKAGRDYELSPYLKAIGRHRERFTVFSGVNLPGVGGLHDGDKCFLTGAPHPKRPGFKNSLSLDQRAAQHLGPLTRFPAIALNVGPGKTSLSFTSDGVPLPSENSPSAVYRQLFVQGSEKQVEAQVRRLKDGQSLMDRIGDRVDALRKDVGAEDRRRLDQYFTSLRELEKRLKINEAWARKPKPQVDYKEPRDNKSPGGVIPKTRLMYDIVRLAFETDSTRLITLIVQENFNPKVDLPGVNMPHHALTHQSFQQNSAAEELAIIETAQMKCLGDLLDGLHGVKESSQTLLDRTMVLHGSNLGNAGRHDGDNLPILLAGGGFKHGQHLVFDRKHNYPLSNLYVSMLQRLGIETDRFSSGKSTMTGLEMV